jgi:hypothetical protein
MRVASRKMRLYRSLSRAAVLVGVLIVHGEIHILHISGSDGGDLVDDPQLGVGHDEAVHRTATSGGQLLAEEFPGGPHAVHRLRGQRTEHDGAQEATHAVYPPHVQRVVPAHLLAELHTGVAPEGSQDLEGEGGAIEMVIEVVIEMVIEMVMVWSARACVCVCV